MDQKDTKALKTAQPPICIRYRFTFPDWHQTRFILELDPETLVITNAPPPDPPSWTRLEFHQCPNCAFCPGESVHCPLAVHLARVVEGLGNRKSYEKVRVEVFTAERTIITDTTLQRGMSSLMGLVMAVGGCPHTEFLKPMARFHLPFSNEAETIYRVASMYLLGQYFLEQDGKDPDLKLQGLQQRYAALEEVNVTMARRLRAASENDSTVNAIVLLDVYTKLLPLSISRSLEKIRDMFSALIGHGDAA